MYSVMSWCCVLLFLSDLQLGNSENVPRMAIYRDVGLSGFHRTLSTNFSIDNLHSEFKDCEWAMDQIIPSGAYVDPYQIEEYERSNKIHHHVQIIGVVNIEAAQPNAGDLRLIVFFNESALTNKGTFIVEFPFHLRYHKAKSGGGSADVRLKAPVLLARCNEMEALIVKAPCCYMCHDCDWKVIQPVQGIDDIVLQVPVGNMDHQQLVTIVTLLMIIGGCYYIISPVSEIIKL